MQNSVGRCRGTMELACQEIEDAWPGALGGGACDGQLLDTQAREDQELVRSLRVLLHQICVVPSLKRRMTVRQFESTLPASTVSPVEQLDH